MQFNKNATDRAKEDIKSAMKTLNDHLLTRTFLVGERISLADIAVACTLLNLYKHVLDPSFRKPFLNVTRWFTTVINEPNAKAVIGSFTLCSKMAEFDAKKFAEFSGKAGGDKKEKGGKAPKSEKKKEPEKKRKRRKRNLLMISQLSPRKKIHLNLCQKAHLILKSGRGFIPIMMRTNLSNGFGNTSIMRTIPSGEEIINTMMNSPWCLCLAT